MVITSIVKPLWLIFRKRLTGDIPVTQSIPIILGMCDALCIACCWWYHHMMLNTDVYDFASHQGPKLASQDRIRMFHSFPEVHILVDDGCARKCQEAITIRYQQRLIMRCHIGACGSNAAFFTHRGFVVKHIANDRPKQSIQRGGRCEWWLQHIKTVLGFCDGKHQFPPTKGK